MDDLLTSLIGMGVNGVNELPKNVQNQKTQNEILDAKKNKQNEEVK